MPMEKQATLMRKGFRELQEMSSRKQHSQEWSPPSSSRTDPSGTSQAVENLAEQMATPFTSGYMAEIEELQKYFLTRPGCPRFSHQATSTSNFGNNFQRISALPSNASTISVSSQLTLDDWNMVLRNAEHIDSTIKYFPASATQSLSVIPKWRSYSEGLVPASQLKSTSMMKIPWYISVLHEKDLYLQKLGEEVSRLSRCEAECARKDEVISVLRDEVEDMQQQLERLQKGSVVVFQKEPPELPKQTPVVAESPKKLPRRGLSLPVPLRQKSIADDFREEIDRLKLELSQSDETLDSKMMLLSETLMKDQEELEQLEKEYADIQQKGLEQWEDEKFGGVGSQEALEGELEEATETGEEAGLHKLQEFQRVNKELCAELEKVKNDYDVATGAISSLQRQLSFEASQLRRAHAEQELLQKELRERGDQLEAMSTKFCNLREERKHEEMMGSIERENYKLRQDVSELESRLAEKSQLIETLQSNVSRLQAELVVSQLHVAKQLGWQKDLHKQLDLVQRVEQQTRVALESISARFERFRSRIIQATYSTPGTKSPQAEISDEEVLEALQRIINDRVDFHQMLKQKGVKVPSLHVTDFGSGLSHRKKGSLK